MQRARALTRLPSSNSRQTSSRHATRNPPTRSGQLVEAVREVGSDISGRNRKKIDLEMQPHADKAITPNCQHSCPDVIGGVEDWNVDDPPASRSKPSARSETRSSTFSESIVLRTPS